MKLLFVQCNTKPFEGDNLFAKHSSVRFWAGERELGVMQRALKCSIFHMP